MKAIVPFMGYASRLSKQMIIDPVNKGIGGRGTGFGGQDAKWLDRTAEITRPLMWMALALAVRGALGGLKPPEEDEIAGALRGRTTIAPEVRSSNRVLIKQDKDSSGGEWWASVKGIGQYSLADNILQTVRGKEAMSDILTEVITVHPFMKAALSAQGINDAYSKDIPGESKAGRFFAQLLVPQMSRLGNDVSRLFSSFVLKSDEIIDAKKQSGFKGFWTAFANQLGVPVGDVKRDKDGRAILTNKQVELIKLAGLNIRYIPYTLEEAEVREEGKTLPMLADKLNDLKLQKLGKYRDDKGQKVTDEALMADLGVTRRGASIDEAYSTLEQEIIDRAKGLKQAIENLEKVGFPKPTIKQKSYHRDLSNIKEALRNIRQK